MRMAARNKQPQGWKIQRVLQPDRKQVGMKVIDAKQAHPQTKGKTLGKGHAHQQAAKQSRPPRHGHQINI